MRHLAALAVFLAAALVWSWPLPLHWRESLAGTLGDPLLLAWTLSWDLHAIRHGLPLFDANIFAPSPLALAFSDHLLGELPVFAAARLLGAGTISAYNTTFIAMVALNGYAAWLLARTLGCSSGASYLAGMGYAFAPWRLAHVDHLAFQATAGYALALAAWVAAGQARGWYAAMAAALAWQSLCGGYHAVYVLFFFSLLAVLSALHRRAMKALVGPLAALVAAYLATLPFLLPYVRMKNALGQISGAHPDWGASIVSFFTAPPADNYWGWTARLWGQATYPEAMLFPGLTVAVLAWLAMRRKKTAPASRSLLDVPIVLLLLWCLWIQITGGGEWTVAGVKIRAHGTSTPSSALLILVGLRIALDRRAREAIAARFFAAEEPLAILGVLGACAGVLAFYGTATLAGFVIPGLGSLRVPARIFLMAQLLLSVMAARYATKSVHTAGICTLLVAVAFAEGLGWPMPVGTPISSANLAPPAALVGPAGDVYRWLASQPDAVVAELPTPDAAHDLAYGYASTLHWRKLVNGSSGYSPRYYDALRETLQGFPDDASLDALRRLGATHVLVHGGPVLHADLVEVARFGETIAYRMSPAPLPRDPVLKDEIGRDGWKVTASHDPNPLGSVRFLTDDNPRTRWSTERSQQPGDSITVGMGAPRTVAGVRLELGLRGSDYPRAYRVETSNDGAAWKTVAEGRILGPPLESYLANPANPAAIIGFEPTSARFVRVVVTGAAKPFWSVAEIRCYSQKDIP
ncbi:MAG: discoidin domain-containing protein [Armatimonadetes bacterium]|nr:discoidin domain-containing protein [Armatimonadota bacterium]